MPHGTQNKEKYRVKSRVAAEICLIPLLAWHPPVPLLAALAAKLATTDSVGRAAPVRVIARSGQRIGRTGAVNQASL